MTKRTKDKTSAERPLTIGELSRRIKMLLEQGVGRVTVEGEISNLRVPSSGHAYFVLKDADAAINAVCFRSTLERVKAPLADGNKIEVTGRVTAYTPRSEYQIIVESAREAGLGELMRRYLELKDKLDKEGLFDDARKRPLPPLPRTLGVATSPTGAAVRDVLNVLGRRAFGLTVLIAPCAVQGAAAPGEIVRALRRLDGDGRCEVIILARGGGSIEDLWSFNDERVVRAVAACRTPVVVGVGHQTDTTLADFAADVRAPTPSAAAEIVTAHYDAFIRGIERAGEAMERAILRHVQQRRAALGALTGAWGMRRPVDLVAAHAQRLDDLDERMRRAMRERLRRRRGELNEWSVKLDRAGPDRRLRVAGAELKRLESALLAARPDRRWLPRLENARNQVRHLDRRLVRAAARQTERREARLTALRGRLDSLDPTHVLRRGYSIITTAGRRRIVTGPGQARPGQTLRVQSAGGEWKATPLPNEPELFDDV